MEALCLQPIGETTESGEEGRGRARAGCLPLPSLPLSLSFPAPRPLPPFLSLSLSALTRHHQDPPPTGPRRPVQGHRRLRPAGVPPGGRARPVEGVDPLCHPPHPEIRAPHGHQRRLFHRPARQGRPPDGWAPHAGRPVRGRDGGPGHRDAIRDHKDPAPTAARPGQGGPQVQGPRPRGGHHPAGGGGAGAVERGGAHHAAQRDQPGTGACARESEGERRWGRARALVATRF